MSDGYGAPLILKADNGPAFIANDTREYLRRIATVLLLSPPYCPQYNGACEAGNGTIKRLAHEIATRHGRPDCWTLNDLEAARIWANRRITERRFSRTPEQRFADHAPASANERETLANTIAEARTKRRADLDIAPGERIRTMTADALDRQAITDALLGIGYITIRNRPVRPCNPLREVG